MLGAHSFYAPTWGSTAVYGVVGREGEGISEVAITKVDCHRIA